MEIKKTSKKSNKIAEIPAPAAEAVLADSKPVKRVSKAKGNTVSSTTAKPSTSPKTAHRHSKLASPPVPVTPEPVVTATVTPAPAPVVSHEDVAKLAYKFWEERNYANGFADEDWLRAEKALAAR